MKAVCNIPVITVGRINDPRMADSIIRTGKADLVAMGRASLVDPEMPNKTKEGRFEDIRHCIGCNAGCMGNQLKGLPSACVLNPVRGHEHEEGVKATDTPKKVLVVGAGPAGLQVAITAAQAGHKVKVYEKTNHPGGQFRLAAVPPSKGEIIDFINWQTTQLKKLDVEIVYNTEVTPELLAAEKPEVVVVATGARPFIPPIPGVELPHVVTAWSILAGENNFGNNCVVIGGGQVGAETAHHLAIQFKNVSIVEMMPVIAGDEVPINRILLMGELEKRRVGMYTNAKVKEITEQVVRIEQNGTVMELPADTVVLATGSKPNIDLVTQIETGGYDVKVIGDAVAIGTVMEAVRAGYELGKSL